MRIALITVLAWLAATIAAAFMANSVYGATAKYDVNIVGAIDEDLRKEVLNLMNQKGKTTRTGKAAYKLKTIRILLDTPGGRADIMEEIGEQMIALRKAGHRIHCNIVRAYSAGFYIASLCTKRVAFADATMMWHYAWYPYIGPMNVPIAREIEKELLELQEEFDTVIRWSFKVTDEQFEYLKTNDIIAPVGVFNELSPGWIEIYPAK